MAETLTPDCPQCRQPPRMVLGAEAFCGNDQCSLFSWTPTASLDANLMDADFIDLSPPMGGP